MKAYRIELLVIDFDGLGAGGVRSTIENTSYANDCISPSVVTVDERDIGEWSDDNPLNNRSTADAEFRRLFAAPAAGTEKDAVGTRMAAWLYGLSKSSLPYSSWAKKCADLSNEWDAAITTHTKAKEGA